MDLGSTRCLHHHHDILLLIIIINMIINAFKRINSHIQKCTNNTDSQYYVQWTEGYSAMKAGVATSNSFVLLDMDGTDFVSEAENKD